MPSFNAPRCQHIKTGGTQCGSPALRGQQLCHYHRQSRPKDVPCYEDWLTPGHSGNITLPVFEDAHSVQFVVRQVTEMILKQWIHPKSAGLALYGLQIASANLKRLETEKPDPTHIVIDLDKVAETPLGMTPWSATGEGHDPEEEEEYDEGEEDDDSDSDSDDETLTEDLADDMTPDDRSECRSELVAKGFCTQEELNSYYQHDGPDPLRLALNRLVDALHQPSVNSTSDDSEGGQSTSARKEAESQPGELPPGTIQACSAEIPIPHPLRGMDSGQRHGQRQRECTI